MGLPVILILYTTVRIMIKMMIGEKIQRMAAFFNTDKKEF